MSARTSVPAGTLLRCMVEGVAEAGCDEAGRGCLCGPVSCAAVILPPDFRMPELNDSKKLTASMRTRLRPVIEEQALAWAVVMVEAEEIDRINILNASIAGMQLALDRLEVRRRKQVQAISRSGEKHRHTIPYRCKGRRKIHGDSGCFGSCKDSSRRTYARACLRMPRIWLGKKHGISHPRPLRRVAPSRSHQIPSPLIPSR